MISQFSFFLQTRKKLSIFCCCAISGCPAIVVGLSTGMAVEGYGNERL